MSEYDGMYIRLAGSPTFYAIDNGEKTIVQSPEHMHQIGLRNVYIVTSEVLNSIPFARADDDEEE